MKDRKGFNRKFRKLKNNPALFFTDFIKNRQTFLVNSIFKMLPRKKGAVKKFTIISAVYNVAPYLNEFIESVTQQRLDFETNIELILVDDGSPDNSREIIQDWVKKYPMNIFYIYKKNGGQSSARNLGLKYVKTEWVTFIDPDDFLDVNYFYLINKVLKDKKDIGALITKFKLYKEKFGTFHDGFQTDFCFTKPVRIVKASDMEDCVQFSSSSSLYKTSVIQKKHIRFDTRLTASFEDTKFFYEYLYAIQDEEIAYVRDALYYYRLRADESSSSNGQWNKKAKYQQFFDFGLLEVVRLFKDNNGKIPVFIQRLILFSVIPYLQVASINRNRIEKVLTESEVNNLLRTIHECLEYIDNDVLEKFYTPPGNHFWISAIFNYFKHKQVYQNRVYINKVDVNNLKVYLRFYGESNINYQMFIDGRFIAPVSARVFKHKIFDDVLINEFNICYTIPDGGKLRFEINGKSAPIYTDFKLLSEEDTDFYQEYKRKESRLKNIAIFVDAGYKADDNAEHLYRTWHIKKKISLPFESYYLLDKKNKAHWERLEEEGFKLLDINSLKAAYLLKNAKYVFSSYLPGHYGQWIAQHNFKFQEFIFLQHGVMTSNLSKPFNASYSQIYKMVISTGFEKEEIISDMYNYIFHEQDLIESGIPRLDNLFIKAKKFKGGKKRTLGKVKKILICPTWRSRFNTLNLKQEKNISEFFCSEYLKNWIGFLNSDFIRDNVDKGRFEITFCPHVNFHELLMENGLSEKVYGKINNKVKILNPEDISYQNLFMDYDLLITDYSSLHFDFATLRKPVIYFQFDREEFYGTSHAYQKGIFDFQKYGFGPVMEGLEDLIEVLYKFDKHGNSIFKNYSHRVDDVFLSNSGNSAMQILQSVMYS